MIIENDIGKYCVSPDSSVYKVVEIIGASKESIVLCVGPNKKLLGVFTNGDLLRLLVEHNEKALSMPIQSVVNRKFKYARFGESLEEINPHLEKVNY